MRHHISSKSVLMFVLAFALMLFVMVGLARAELEGTTLNSAKTESMAVVINEGVSESTIQGARGFPNAEAAPYPNLPYTDGKSKIVGPQYSRTDDITRYQDRFTKKEIDNMRINVTSNNVEILVSTIRGEVPTKARVKNILVYTTDPADDGLKVKVVGWVMARAKKGDVMSEEVLAAAMNEAWKLGGNSIYGRDGYTRTIVPKAVGFGFVAALAGLFSSEATGGIINANGSITAGKTNVEDRPWIKVHVLVTSR